MSISISDWPRSDIFTIVIVLLCGVGSLVSRLSEDYMGITSFALVMAGFWGFYVLIKMKFHWLKLLIVLLSWGLAFAALLSIWMKYGEVD